MIRLSFDQSTKISGYAVFDDDKYVASGIIDLHKITDTNERSRQMGVELCKKIEEIKPDMIFLEEVQCQSNVDTVKKLARIQGMVIGFAAAHDIQTHIIEPSRWRAVLHFKQGRSVERAALKEQGIAYVKNNFGFDLSEDECEAICQNVAAQKIYNTHDDLDI